MKKKKLNPKVLHNNVIKLLESYNNIKNTNVYLFSRVKVLKKTPAKTNSL